MELSIIIPIYNRTEWVESLVRHCYELASLKEVEIIIVDDGSSDETFKELAKSVPSEWVLLHQKNAGAAAARQLGFEHSTGKYIQFVDSDDELFVEEVTQRISALNTNLGVDVIYGSWKMGKNMQSAKHCLAQENVDMLIALLEGRWNPNFSYVFRREVVERSGGWNALSSLNDDFEFALRVAASGAKFFCLKKCVTGLYRWHPGERLSRQSDAKNAQATYPMLESVYTLVEESGKLNQERKTAFAQCAWRLAKSAYLENEEIYQQGKDLAQQWDNSVISDGLLPKFLGVELFVAMSERWKLLLKNAKRRLKRVCKY